MAELEAVLKRGNQILFEHYKQQTINIIWICIDLPHLGRVSGQLGHSLPVLEVWQLAGVEPGEGGQNGGCGYWYWAPAPCSVFSPLSKGFDVGDDGRVLAPGQPLLQQQSHWPRPEADKKWEMCDIALSTYLLYLDIYCI